MLREKIQPMKLQRRTTAPALHWVSAVCRWLIIATIAGQLVFAHGCHGDEDHELFGAVQRLVK
jgi:hypothetical protein